MTHKNFAPFFKLMVVELEKSTKNKNDNSGRILEYH